MDKNVQKALEKQYADGYRPKNVIDEYQNDMSVMLDHGDHKGLWATGFQLAIVILLGSAVFALLGGASLLPLIIPSAVIASEIVDEDYYLMHVRYTPENKTLTWIGDNLPPYARLCFEADRWDLWYYDQTEKWDCSYTDSLSSNGEPKMDPMYVNLPKMTVVLDHSMERDAENKDTGFEDRIIYCVWKADNLQPPSLYLYCPGKLTSAIDETFNP